MSAVVKIDGSGSLPGFLDKAQAGLDRMVKSEGNVKGAMRGITAALDSAGNGAQMASKAADALADKFVRGIAGTAVVGAFKIVSDQISNMAETLGTAGSSAAKAIDQLQALGDPKNFAEAASQAAGLQQAMTGINDELRKIESNPMRNFMASITGAKEEMKLLVESMQRAADAQLALGIMTATKRTKDTAGMTAEQVRNYDLQASRRAELDAVAQIQNPAIRKTAIDALNERFLIEDYEAQDKFFRETDPERKSAKAGFDGGLYDLQRDRARERMRTDFQAGLKEAQRQAEEMASARKTEEMNLNTMQIVEAQSALDAAEQRKKEVDRRVIETDAAAAKIAQGVFGSARGPGQRLTSVEVGINRAVDRAFNQQTIKSSRAYRDQIKAELGPGADGYAVNRAIQAKRVKDAEEKAKAPFEAAKAAKDQQGEILRYMQGVQDVLNELKAYAHAT